MSRWRRPSLASRARVVFERLGFTDPTRMNTPRWVGGARHHHEMNKNSATPETWRQKKETSHLNFRRIRKKSYSSRPPFFPGLLKKILWTIYYFFFLRQTRDYKKKKGRKSGEYIDTMEHGWWRCNNHRRRRPRRQGKRHWFSLYTLIAYITSACISVLYKKGIEKNVFNVTTIGSGEQRPLHKNTNRLLFL